MLYWCREQTHFLIPIMKTLVALMCLNVLDLQLCIDSFEITCADSPTSKIINCNDTLFSSFYLYS
jgi:hypothetical protein